MHFSCWFQIWQWTIWKLSGGKNQKKERSSVCDSIVKICLVFHPRFSPDASQLKACLHSLLHEQQQLLRDASLSTLSSIRLRQRLVVLERYFIALLRHSPEQNPAITAKKREEVAGSSPVKVTARRWVDWPFQYSLGLHSNAYNPLQDFRKVLHIGSVS